MRQATASYKLMSTTTELGTRASYREGRILQLIHENGGSMILPEIRAKSSMPKYKVDTALDDLVLNGFLDESAPILLTDCKWTLTDKGKAVIESQSSEEEETNENLTQI